MKAQKDTSLPAYPLLLASFVFFTVLTFTSEGAFGGADGIVHYRIARYAFQYPHLFLDLWGKPLFTILSAPFAQFGYSAMKLFNVLVATATALFAFWTLRRLKITYAFVVIPAILFSPVYFELIPSAMTELLFGLIIVLSVFLFFNGNYWASAIVISFLPFSRNEGFILMPLFFLAYTLKRDFKSIPFLATGFLFFSFLGWKTFGAFLWILKNNPYTGASAIYGHGELLHFVDRSPAVFGIPLLILFFLGLALSVWQVARDRFAISSDFYFLLLVAGGGLIYFVAHSFVWWKGMGGSLGLTRVMAGIVPLFAMMGVYGLHKMSISNRIKNLASLVMVAAVIYVPFASHRIPFQLDVTEKLLKETSGWIVEKELDKRLIFYYNPVVCHYLKVDPFDSSKAREQIANREKPEESVPTGSIVIWDAHFGPNEGQMPLERLQSNPAFREIYHTEPIEEIRVLNGYKYEIFVFERI